MTFLEVKKNHIKEIKDLLFMNYEPNCTTLYSKRWDNISVEVTIIDLYSHDSEMISQ